MSDQPRVRNLVIVIGDQLDADSAAFDEFDSDCDVVLQMEVMEEATYVRQRKKRSAFSMHHFRVQLEARGRPVHYVDRRFAANARMRDQYVNLDRKTPVELPAIRSQADKITAALL